MFVGRTAALATIRAGAEDAAAGRPGVVWVEGEAGAGKTALVDHALHVLADTVTVARAEADELATPA